MPTIANLITEIRDTLDEPTASAWTDDMLRRWINEAGRDLSRATRFIKDTVSLPLVADQQTYDLPTYVISVEQAYYVDPAGQSIPLEPRHHESMDNVWGKWQNNSGNPGWFTILGMAPVSQLMLFPVPTTADDLRLIVSRTYVEIPTSDPTSTEAGFPVIWYDALVDYVEYKALRRDRDPRWQEARDLYLEKRDNFTNNADLMPIAREMTPTPNGYVDAWLVDPNWY